eukprot:UN02203
MLALFETPAGYALFKVNKTSMLDDENDVYKNFQTPTDAKKAVSLQAFQPFSDAEAAVTAAAAVVQGTLDPALKTFLEKSFKDSKQELAVMDQTLGNLIKQQIGIPIVYKKSVLEMMRGIRQNIETLIASLTDTTAQAMRLGLSHGLARFTLAFSPDKIDTMIIHSIALLDELDKELNQYIMRARDWYGLHFPEISKIVTDNLQYAKVIVQMGLRVNAPTQDFSNILDADTETKLKEQAEVSMGSEISEEDILNIQALCQQVISLSEYRLSLYEYLQNRMNAIAPNLSSLVGELVGARLIAHAGSLVNLAKYPASTVQILGAEKALFRAIKAKSKKTPKYGLIFNVSLLGQANPRIKPKIARLLAAKTSLSTREDAFGEGEGVTIGYKHQLQIEQRMRALERMQQNKSFAKGMQKGGQDKYKRDFNKVSGGTGYNASNDMKFNKEDKQKDFAPKNTMNDDIEDSSKKDKKE